MPREKVKEVKPFTPKNHKELVEWYLVQIESGVATKRDFIRLASRLKEKPKAAPKKAEKPAGKAVSVGELKAIGKKAEKPAEKKK